MAVKNFDILAGRLKGITVGDKPLDFDLLKEIISKEEEFELKVTENIHILENDQLETLKKARYDEGKTVGSEMTLKEIKNKAGLEAEGIGKNLDLLFAELTKKIQKESGAEPSKKISELTESLQKLQTQIQQKDTDLQSWQEKYDGVLKNTKIEKVLSSSIPENLAGLSKEHFATLFRTEGYSVEFDDQGNPMPTLNGKVLKDKYEKALPLQAVTLDYATRNKWINGEGRGDDDKPGGSRFKTETDVYRYMEQNNINPVSEQAEKLIKEFKAQG